MARLERTRPCRSGSPEPDDLDAVRDEFAAIRDMVDGERAPVEAFAARLPLRCSRRRMRETPLQVLPLGLGPSAPDPRQVTSSSVTSCVAAGHSIRKEITVSARCWSCPGSSCPRPLRSSVLILDPRRARPGPGGLHRPGRGEWWRHGPGSWWSGPDPGSLEGAARAVRPRDGGPALMRIGIDLGGTKTEIACLDADGAVLERFRRAQSCTAGRLRGRTLRPPSPIWRRSAPRRLAAGSRTAIGRRHARSADLRDPGRMKNCNSTCLNDRPLPADLAQLLGREVLLANDADCFALTEALDGAGRGAHCVFGVILGTGVGGGIVVGGRLARPAPTASPGSGGTIRLPALASAPDFGGRQVHHGPAVDELRVLRAKRTVSRPRLTWLWSCADAGKSWVARRRPARPLVAAGDGGRCRSRGRPGTASSGSWLARALQVSSTCWIPTLIVLGGGGAPSIQDISLGSRSAGADSSSATVSGPC
ncbi:MAG: ROK family protein [Gammaproteobacteria bacterium]|nr:ROK family protein [Gammaproteobacteria bacterium]